jgi:hypothetical protein
MRPHQNSNRIQSTELAAALSKTRSKGKRENAAALFGAPKRNLVAVDSEEVVDGGVER